MRVRKLVLKSLDFLHLVLWAVSIFGLLQILPEPSPLSLLCAIGPVELGCAWVRSVEEWIFWGSFVAVILLTSVVLIRVGVRRKPEFAEIVVALIGWAALLYFVTQFRS
ncbi:hypothetical protein [Stenotrophomonas sp. PS02289]|uniref:hypothetical protein n=1 Tax=Stenotrophomonas sp. PS02289 TaxID=2991422 RepID=UPI00249C9F5E|nr:hypothetical protein [Stenotrophomonas sp. PS02289]